MKENKIKEIFEDDLITGIILAEELALSMGKEEEKPSTLVKKCTTFADRYVNKKAIRDFAVVNVEDYFGRVREITLVTDNNTYRFQVIVDNYIMFDNIWKELEEVSKYTNLIDVFQDDTRNYILRMAEINYSKKVLIRVIPLSPLTIIQGVVTYDKCSVQ